MITFLNQIQDQVSQTVGREVMSHLPMGIDDVVLICRVYGIRPMFFKKGERVVTGANCDLQRWICRTDSNLVTSISIG